MQETLAHPSDDPGFGLPLDADPRVAAQWGAAIERTNKARSMHLRLPSPVELVDDVMRLRALPAMPWPVQWSELARRCRTYPGDLVAVTGGSGSGKTQFAIQAAIAFAAAGRGPVLWVAAELTPPDVSLRIVANRVGRHMFEIREQWSRRRITDVLATVTDRWRYVDIIRGALELQIGAIDAAVEMATQIYGAPPLLVVDYVQKLTRGREDQRNAVGEAMQHLGDLVVRHQCYGLILSQTSRGNAPNLAGKNDIESATDQIGAGAESSAIENDAANGIALNVFKADDAPDLDAHWLVTKARHTGLEGKVGARYRKAGGQWEELDHLPATIAEVAAETRKAAKRDRPTPPSEARDALNAARAEEAANRRREAVIAALRFAGAKGIALRELRALRGTGAPRALARTLEELRAAGRAQVTDGRWMLVL